MLKSLILVCIMAVHWKFLSREWGDLLYVLKGILSSVRRGFEEGKGEVDLEFNSISHYSRVCLNLLLDGFTAVVCPLFCSASVTLSRSFCLVLVLLWVQGVRPVEVTTIVSLSLTPSHHDCPDLLIAWCLPAFHSVPITMLCLIFNFLLIQPPRHIHTLPLLGCVYPALLIYHPGVCGGVSVSNTLPHGIQTRTLYLLNLYWFSFVYQCLQTDPVW